MKLHLVDGTFELFRGYYGGRPATTPDGQEVGATRSLMRSMHALVREPGVSHVAVAFDHVIESFRNGLFDGYKTGDGIEPTLLSQFSLAEQAVSALGITVWPMVDFEADDALATGAHLFADDCEQVVICSPDKDLCQCVRGDRVVTLDRIRRTRLDEAGVIEKFGVTPASIPDWLALVGDTADGIPGIPRWGKKSAATVLHHYGHIEAIPDDAAQWPLKVRGAASLAEQLAGAREDAMLYRRLATLRTDVPLGCALPDLEVPAAPDAEALSAFCERLGEDPARFQR